MGAPELGDEPFSRGPLMLCCLDFLPDPTMLCTYKIDLYRQSHKVWVLLLTTHCRIVWNISTSFPRTLYNPIWIHLWKFICCCFLTDYNFLFLLNRSAHSPLANFHLTNSFQISLSFIGIFLEISHVASFGIYVFLMWGWESAYTESQFKLPADFRLCGWWHL